MVRPACHVIADQYVLVGEAELDATLASLQSSSLGPYLKISRV